jgi:hypothetical protein
VFDCGFLWVYVSLGHLSTDPNIAGVLEMSANSAIISVPAFWEYYRYVSQLRSRDRVRQRYMLDGQP